MVIEFTADLSTIIWAICISYVVLGFIFLRVTAKYIKNTNPNQILYDADYAAITFMSVFWPLTFIAFLVVFLLNFIVLVVKHTIFKGL